MSSDTLTLISGGSGSALLSTQASSGKIGSADADARLCISPLGRRTNLGALARGPMLPPSAILRPKGRGRRAVSSPRPRLLAPGQGQWLRGMPVQLRDCWWRPCGWMLEGGGSEPPVTSLPNPQQLPKRRWETGLEKVMMTRSSASTSMDLWKMRAWRLRQHAVTLPLRIMADII